MQQILSVEKVDKLKECLLLKSLSAIDLNTILQTSYTTILPKNQVLFRQGEPFNYFYLLISGNIALQLLAPNGSIKTLEIIYPNQIFAEALLFLNQSQYPVSAIATSDSVAIAIDAKSYKKILNSSNDLCFSLLGKISQKLHFMLNEIEQLTLHNANFRLVNYLLNNMIKEQNNQAIVILVASKNVVASRLSVKPETISRLFKSLTDRGLIKLTSSTIKILNITKLRASIATEI